MNQHQNSGGYYSDEGKTAAVRVRTPPYERYSSPTLFAVPLVTVLPRVAIFVDQLGAFNMTVLSL